jgi:hypothetical protein
LIKIKSIKTLNVNAAKILIMIEVLADAVMKKRITGITMIKTKIRAAAEAVTEKKGRVSLAAAEAVMEKEKEKEKDMARILSTSNLR